MPSAEAEGHVRRCGRALGIGEHPASAEATDDCQALAWDGATMSQLWERIPCLALNAL